MVKIIFAPFGGLVIRLIKLFRGNGPFFQRIDDYIKRHLEVSHDVALWLMLICSVCFPLSLIIYPLTESVWIDSLGLLFSALGLIGLYFNKKYFHYYWLAFFIFVFPFNFTYNYFENISSATYSTGINIMLIAVPVLLSDLLASTFIITLGVILAYSYSSITLSNIQHYLLGDGPLYAFIIAFLIGLALGKKKDSEIKQKLKTLAISHSIAHEVKTPATVIKLYNDELKCLSHPNQATNNKILTIIDIVDKQVKNIVATIDFLLLNIKSTNAKPNLTLKKISMYDCIEDAIRTYPYQNKIDHTNIDWKKTSDFTINGEPMLMRNVFFNLIRNSIRAILEKGSGKITIYNTSDEKFNYLFFTDSGCGIKKNHLHQLFKSFFTTDIAGTGLGLFYCKNIIEQCGGSIKIKSKYKEYFRVIMKYPI